MMHFLPHQLVQRWDNYIQVLTLFTRNFTVGKDSISEVVQPHVLTVSDKAGFQESEVYLKYIPTAYAHRNE